MEQIDRYLSRCLKNWAANQQASPPTREQIQQAATVPRFQEQPYFRTSTAIREYSSNRIVGYYTGEWLRGSFSVSLGWPGQLESLFPVTG